LSVAVVVRSPPVAAAAAADPQAEEPAAAGPETIDGFTAAQLEKMTQLVKEAVGFDPARGDTVSVTGAEFMTPVAPEPLPEPPVWQRPWVWDVAKQTLGALFVLFLVFAVLRPAMKSLVKTQAYGDGQYAVAADGSLVALPSGGATQGGGSGTQAALPGADPDKPAHPMIKGPELPRDVEGVRDYVNKEPKIAAQVVRGWVGDEK
jgi:flagellar M-ring protein FliF